MFPSCFHHVSCWFKLKLFAVEARDKASYNWAPWAGTASKSRLWICKHNDRRGSSCNFAPYRHQPLSPSRRDGLSHFFSFVFFRTQFVVQCLHKHQLTWCVTHCYPASSGSFIHSRHRRHLVRFSPLALPRGLHRSPKSSQPKFFRYSKWVPNDPSMFRLLTSRYHAGKSWTKMQTRHVDWSSCWTLTETFSQVSRVNHGAKHLCQTDWFGRSLDGTSTWTYLDQGNSGDSGGSKAKDLNISQLPNTIVTISSLLDLAGWPGMAGWWLVDARCQRILDSPKLWEPSEHASMDVLHLQSGVKLIRCLN